MKNILVPTDFSPESHYAFEAALQIAKRTDGHVTLLHAVELPATASFSTFGGPVGSSSLTNNSDTDLEQVYHLKLLETSKQHLRDLVAEAARLAPGVPVANMVQTTQLDIALPTFMEQHHTDLVVMGAQGHTAAEHFFYGSNTERMVRTAPCPVLAVKHSPGAFDVQTMVFPSDFTTETDHAGPELRRVQALFPQAKLQLLSVVPEASRRQAALEDITAFARRHHLGSHVALVVEAPSPSDGIMEFVQQTNPDLVVLPTHGRTGLSRLLQTSIAEKVATGTFPPVLTFRLQ